MHKLMEYICDELDELERKASKDGKLSMAEVQYGDMLAHFKKNLMKAEEMEGEEGYSERGYSRRGGSYARGGNRGGRYSREGGSYEGDSYEGGGSYARGRTGNVRRDSMGRYSRDGYSMADEEMVMELRELMEDAPDEKTRQEFKRFIQKIEAM